MKMSRGCTPVRLQAAALAVLLVTILVPGANTLRLADSSTFRRCIASPDDSTCDILDLTTSQVSGTIPTSIGLLTRLKKINLYSNRLEGTIPSEIGLLSRLEFMDLGKNRLAGTIPTELGRLTAIMELYLEANNLEGAVPWQLATLRKVAFLYLDDNADLCGSMPSIDAASSNHDLTLGYVTVTYDNTNLLNACPATEAPTKSPTASPTTTRAPTITTDISSPTPGPTTIAPTIGPTSSPTAAPTTSLAPTAAPTSVPTATPTSAAPTYAGACVPEIGIPDTHCRLSEWSISSSCSASCGIGNQSSTRTVLANHTGCGIPCAAFELSVIQECYLAPCVAAEPTFEGHYVNRFEHKRMTLRPESREGTAGYGTTFSDVSGISFDTTGHTRLSMSDDSSVNITFAPRSFPFFGMSKANGGVCSNGYIYFSGDCTYNTDARVHFGQQRISVLAADLDPSAGGDVFDSGDLLADRRVITWVNVPFFGVVNESANAQVELIYSGPDAGVISITIGQVSNNGNIKVIGVSQGHGVPTGFRSLLAPGTPQQTIGNVCVFGDLASDGCIEGAGHQAYPNFGGYYSLGCYDPASILHEVDVEVTEAATRCFSPTLRYGSVGDSCRQRMTFAEAQAYCANLFVDGANDWRLPATIEEAGAMCGSGCGFDGEDVWFDTAALPSSSPTAATLSPTEYLSSSPTSSPPAGGSPTPMTDDDSHDHHHHHLRKRVEENEQRTKSVQKTFNRVRKVDFFHHHRPHHDHS